MTEGRGRGRAALFRSTNLREDNEPPPVAHASGQGTKPRGRASFLNVGAGDGDCNSSGASSFESGTVLSGSSTSSDENVKPKVPMGRAALFGSKSSSSGICSDFSSAVRNLKITEDTHSYTKGNTPDKPSPIVRLGTSGRKIEVIANYVRLELTDTERGIYEYEVNFEPEIDHRLAKMKLVNKHMLNVGGKVKVYDSGCRLWTPTRTKEDITTGVYELKNGDSVKVTFKYKREKKFADCQIILNIIMKRIMGELQLIRFGRSNYNPMMAHHIMEHKLSVWPGCVTAVEEYEGGILLNCDASHRVLQDNTIHDLIYEIAKLERGQGGSGNKSTFNEKVHSLLIGMSVITKYNNNIVKIDDIDFDKTPRSTFEKNGQQISYVEYYKKAYNIDIKDERQPLLMSRVKRKLMGKEKVDIENYYVPELCSPTGLTDAQRSNFKLMKEVATITQLVPEKRDNALRSFLAGIHENENCKQLLADWGLRLPTKCVELEARTLEPETIYFGHQKNVQEPSADWGRALSSAPMLNSVDLYNWAIVYTPRDKTVANKFFEKSLEICRKLDQKIGKPEKIEINNDRTQTYCEVIKRLRNTSLQLVVIIFPSQRDDRYAAVKKLCVSEMGLPSQVVNSRTLQKDDRAIRSIIMKILLQMNCKLGGSLWGVSIPYREDGIMFLGVDVYHEAGRRSQSIIALVSTTNKTATRWTSGTAIHNRGQEISDMITQLFRDCMQEWHKANGNYPKRIIMFRDGVGDGQLKVVKDFEIPQFKKVFSQIHSDYKPYLTYAIVQKRINTRYYMKRGRVLENPPPGTVLDHTITRRDWYDYFLVSQNVRQGTVSPTHYVVVEDSSDMTPDQVQRLTYKLTHLYYNWNGTVRVPAPCQYAHKLAYLIGQHVHIQANEGLRNTLYFL